MLSPYVLVLVLVVCAGAQDPVVYTLTYPAVGGPTRPFPNQPLQTGNLAGPATVTVRSTLADVMICAEPVVASTHPPLQTNCAGAYVATQNATNAQEVTAAAAAKKSYSAFATNKRLTSRFVGSARYSLMADAETEYKLDLVANTLYAVTVYSPDNTTSSPVTVTLMSQLCNPGTIGDSKGGCQLPVALTSTGTATQTIDAGATKYFTYPATGSWSNITFTSTDDDFEALFRLGATPTAKTAFLFPEGHMEQFGKSKSWQVVGSTPGVPWVISVTNNDDAALEFTILTTSTQCDVGKFGLSCLTPTAEITAMNADNNTVVKIKVDDLANDEFTYVAVGAPAQPKGNIIRFSVVSDRGTHSAPLLATWGAPPSLSNYHLNATGNYVNQLLLPQAGVAGVVPQPGFEAKWYVGMYHNNHGLTYWIGDNCQPCKNDGKCYCSAGANGACDDTSKWTINFEGDDSYGRCACTSTKKDNYICSSEIPPSTSQFNPLIVALISIVGAIILAVAIGVPLYCYLQNRVRSNYERV